MQQGSWCLRLRVRRAYGMRSVDVSKLPMDTKRFPREPEMINKDSKSFHIVFSYFWYKHDKRPLV